MSKTYLPTSDQMDETLDNLKRIAMVLGAKIDRTSWGGIQAVVKSGMASKLFPIGTQFIVSHNTYGDMVYDVVAHDYFKSAVNPNNHTMTLMCHDIVARIQYDAPEALHYVSQDLPAGTYNFTHGGFGVWSKGTYQFTLRGGVPMGGQLCIVGDPATTDTKRIMVYSRGYEDTEASEIVDITAGNGGTSLGTCGAELNHIHRGIYGSNNYGESAIRQFLNSSAQAGRVWTPQTKYDRPPSWLTSLAGFKNGLDAQLSNVIGEVIVPCVGNDTYESTDSSASVLTKYSVSDSIFFASQKEITGAIDDTVEDGTTQFPYYRGAVASDRIKYWSSVATNWWTRSPGKTGADRVRLITTDGSNRYYGASNNVGVVPCFNIV